MAASSIQFIFDLNAVYHSSDEVFWREFFKELFTRPPLYFMISGMVLIFIGFVCREETNSALFCTKGNPSG